MIQFPKDIRKPVKKMPFMKGDAEPGRNDICPCGSGLKYKKCCLKKKEFIEQKINLTTMLKLLYCLVKGLKGQSVIITKRTVDERVPNNWMEQMDIQSGMIDGVECYKVSIKAEKKSEILTPDRNIVLPGEN